MSFLIAECLEYSRSLVKVKLNSETILTPFYDQFVNQRMRLIDERTKTEVTVPVLSRSK